MCSIIGSFNRHTFKDLVELNRYRGEHSHSLAVIDLDAGLVALHRGFSGIPNQAIDKVFANYPGCYIVGHMQAPTTDAKDESAIHPARDTHDAHLWHNGIIKEDCIAQMQRTLGDDTPWDTALLNRWISEGHSLNDVDGSFACMRHDHTNGLTLFRNALSPLFLNAALDLSSTKFAGAAPVTENVVWRLDLEYGRKESISTFSTKNTFYIDINDL